MPDYAIKVIPKGKPIIDHSFTGTKAEARGRAREIARELYPDASMRWSMDATVVFRDGAYVASVAVEQGEKENSM